MSTYADTDGNDDEIEEPE